MAKGMPRASVEQEGAALETLAEHARVVAVELGHGDDPEAIRGALGEPDRVDEVAAEGHVPDAGRADEGAHDRAGTT